MTTNQMKSVQMELLQYVDTVCCENGLRYYAAYGTLLGAIRHHGYIPWDDDIDIYMPRRDFERFAEYVGCRSDHYATMSMSDENYHHPFAKLYDVRTSIIENGIPTRYDMGIYLDIFVLDGLPKSHPETHYRKCHILIVLLYCVANNVYPKDAHGLLFVKSVAAWMLAGSIRLLHLEEKLKEFFIKESGRFPFDGSTQCFPQCNAYREIYTTSGFGDGGRAEFEGMWITIPSNYIDCLTQCYGDYMQLPPEEERTATHSSVAYWKE